MGFVARAGKPARVFFGLYGRMLLCYCYAMPPKLQLPDVEIVKAHLAGNSINAIAHSYACDFHVIESRLAACGVQVRRRAFWTPQEAHELRRRYEAGESKAEPG